MSKCKAESVVGYRLREFPGQTPLLLFTSLTFRVGGCGTCKDVQYTSSCRPKRRGEIGAEGSITHSCMVARRGTALSKGKAAVSNRIHLEGPQVVSWSIASVLVGLAVVTHFVGVDQLIRAVLDIGLCIVGLLEQHWLLSLYIGCRLVEHFVGRLLGRLGVGLFFLLLLTPTWPNNKMQLG